MSKQSPSDVAVLELRGTDLSGESAIGLVVDVLGRDLDSAAEVLTGEEEVEGWRGDDDLCDTDGLSANGCVCT